MIRHTLSWPDSVIVEQYRTRAGGVYEDLILIRYIQSIGLRVMYVRIIVLCAST
jgi:hypothetical protein